jgi:uncharacterized membrane protein YGL010W
MTSDAQFDLQSPAPQVESGSRRRERCSRKLSTKHQYDLHQRARSGKTAAIWTHNFANRRNWGNWGLHLDISEFIVRARRRSPRLGQMSRIFRDKLAAYADYHRDARNCAMHVVGNPILFLAAVLPPSLLSVTVFGVQTNVAVLLVIPALILWIVFDVGIGLAIVGVAIPLLFAAAMIASHAGVAWVWTITGGLIVTGWALQIVGHSLFEHRRPALLDNPIHMLISPMFVFAKLFIALGFRRDLAAVLHKPSQQMSCDSSLYQRDGWADSGQYP